MDDDYIIVCGSGSNQVPDIYSNEIYSSNGSAEIASVYKRKYNKAKHTCVIGARAFLKLDHVKPRVIEANPDRIIIRDYEKISYQIIKKLFDSEKEFINYKRIEQFNFQKQFFNLGLLDLFKAEINYEYKLLNKIIHFLKFYSSNDFLGVSSGFYAILHAIHNNPGKKIIVSGISFEGGNHYYKEGMMSLNRGRVDNYLIKRLKKEIKNKIFVVDKIISTKYDLNFIDLKLLF